MNGRRVSSLFIFCSCLGWYYELPSQWLLICLSVPVPLLPPPPSLLRSALAWSSPHFPRPVGKQCPPQLSLTGDRVVPGGARGSVWGRHGGPAPAPPVRGHTGFRGGCILWRHPPLWERAVPPPGHQHQGPCQDHVSLRNIPHGGGGRVWLLGGSPRAFPFGEEHGDSS